MIIVVGGGPAGLAMAAAAKMEGLSVRVLDGAGEVGASWMAHYDRLKLHTVRWLSGLPGKAIPREYGPWVARDHVVAYLKDYAKHHQLDIQHGVEVTKIDYNGQAARHRLAAAPRLAPLASPMVGSSRLRQDR